MKNLKIILFTIFISINFLFVVIPVFAETQPFKGEFTSDSVNALKTQAQSFNPSGITDPGDLAGKFINFWIFGIGMLALLWTFIAGFMWMTAAGNAERTGKSAKIILWVVLGLTATLMSYGIMRIVFNFVSSGEINLNSIEASPPKK